MLHVKGLNGLEQSGRMSFAGLSREKPALLQRSIVVI